MTTTLNTLRVDASARKSNSVSRQLGDTFVQRLREHATLDVNCHDVSRALPFVDANWVSANSTPLEQRSQLQHDTLALSDSLVEQLETADLLVVTTPIYNFGIPAALKAWIDLIARAGRTFRYTESGPVGLLKNKRAVVLVTSGGTGVGSDIDFVTPYLKQVLGFIGIHDVSFVAADKLGQAADEAISSADRKLTELARTFQ